MKWQLSSPTTDAQWLAYYNLRYQVLRAPWGQPVGSERDELEAESCHQMVVAETGEVVAVGRLHRLADGRGQVRYMAVAPSAQGQGLGALVLKALELQALNWGLSGIVLNARDNAVGFYRRLGYQLGDELPPLFGIAHYQMFRYLQLPHVQAEWPQALQAIWWQTIPLSAFMQLSIDSFDGATLCCKAPLAPNKNLHETMFAGAIYSLLTLTGWGMVWLQLKSFGLSGDIVLADASIRYFAPVHQDARAVVRLIDCRGDLSALAQQRRVRQQVMIQLQHEDKILAELVGRFSVHPHG